MQPNLNDYLALVEKRKAEKEPIELEMPSGAIWLVTPVSTIQLSVAGRLPTGFYLKKNNKNEPLTEREQAEIGVKAMELTRDVMLSNLVFPKITPEPSEKSIGIEEVGEKIDIEDFNFFSGWLMNGAQANKKK